MQKQTISGQIKTSLTERIVERTDITQQIPGWLNSKGMKIFSQHLSLLSESRQHLLPSAEQLGERWPRRPGRVSLPKRNEKGEGAAPGATRDGSGSLYLSDTRWVSEPLHAERERSEGGGGGEFISVRDATRRAKMKADGRWCGGGHRDSGASVFNEPAQYSRFSAEGDVSFDVRGGGVNEAGPFSSRELIFVFLRVKLERRGRDLSVTVTESLIILMLLIKLQFVNSRTLIFLFLREWIVNEEFREFTFKCVDKKDWKERIYISFIYVV